MGAKMTAAATRPDIAKVAVSYASRGWQVFPLHTPNGQGCSCGRSDCESVGKHPRTPDGVKDATTDVKRIFEWWKQWPAANIGIATGAISGIVVVDTDAKDEGPKHWTELLDIHGNVDTLTTIIGGGGNHWFFTVPPDTALRNSVKILGQGGIDTRADGGYIVVPPSLHASGQRYEWDNKVKPVPLPDWLLDRWPKVYDSLAIT